MLVIITGLASLTGCGSKTFTGDGHQVDLMTHYIRTRHLRAGQPIEVTKIEVKRSTAISDELFRVDFDAEATLIKSTYTQLDKTRILTDAGWNEAAYVAASQQARNLSPEVRAALDRERPPFGLNTRFFRADGNQGQSLRLEGSLLARWQVSDWELSELSVKERHVLGELTTLYDLNGYDVSVLPPDSLEISGPDGKRRIQLFVEAQRKYVAAVNEAVAKMAKDQSDDASRLTAVAVTGRSWMASLPDGNRPAQKWIIEFIEVSQDEVLKAVVRHPTDELRRRVFTGRVVLGNFPQIVLEPLDPAGSVIYGGYKEVLSIRPASGGGLRIFVNDGMEGRLEPAPASTSPQTTDEIWADLLNHVQPGTQWTGSARTGTDAADPIKLTFVDVKPDGSYLRAVGETPGDPLTAVVFEGTANRAGVHGWPIVMKAIDSYVPEDRKRDYFTDDVSTLVLAVRDDRLIGHRGADALQFASNTKIEPWAERDKVVAGVFAPGVRLTGRVAHDDGTTEVDLTVADVRENGAYVRVLAQAKDEPFDVVVYEGRFPFQTSMIDGYSLHLHKRTSMKRPEMLFKDEDGTTLRLRLTLDGSSVMGVVHHQDEPRETLSLKIDHARKAAADVATEPFAARVRQLLAKNSQWRGTLRDFRESRSIELTMKILEVNEGDGITAEFSVPRVAGAKVVYEGILQLGDLNINRDCAKLKKTVGGRAEQSAMFDSTVGDDRNMRFMIAPDGVTLYCLTTSSGDERLEQVTLRCFSAVIPPPKPPGAPNKPVPSSSIPSTAIPAARVPPPGTPSPSAPGAKPISDLFRPVNP